MTLFDLFAVMMPVVGVIFMLAVGRYGSRDLRAETARAREAERKAREPAPHAIR
jgi:hypothetical protein